ncbi:fungal-specific transcription factor [Exophiala viscosa]|uniref:fungal-specific transcription factor n=1 Tax=Exophiala viscosa TaxID=2486360 RepID=UPI0021917350|nr:fungal-specific transcription factor [Exophiala viscosa]
MRPPTACVACRNRRWKCEVVTPKSPCTWCQDRQLTCSFTSSTARKKDWSEAHWEPRPYDSSSETGIRDEVASSADYQAAPSTSNGLPSNALRIELVELYFRYIHDTFHSLFHRPSLVQDVIDETIPEVLLFGIISLSSRFSNDPVFTGVDPRVRGGPYARKAQALLDLREVSLTTIQACVLLGAFVITEGEAASEAVFYSIACRSALVLDLPNLPGQSLLDQEVNRRVWWTLRMIDVWSSNGVRIPRALGATCSDVPHPMNEIIFHRLRRGDDSEPLSQESGSSLLTQMVKLNAILIDISSSRLSRHGPPRNCRSANKELNGWVGSLPPNLRDTQDNLSHYAALGLGPMFVAVHLGYYHYGALLYYQYLHRDSYDEHAPTYSYADKCKTHSVGLSEILYRAFSTPGCEVYYTMVGHVLVIASTVPLHILLFNSDEEQTRAARGRLEKNFELLTCLQRLWPTLDVSFARFREFHRACQNYKETSFRMDKWLLRFLLEFANPVGEKDPDEPLTETHPWSMQEWDLSPF